MSGGHWNYENDWKLGEILRLIASDTCTEFPELSSIFQTLSVLLPNISHEIDWDFSGDSSIDDKKEFDKKWSLKIRKALKASSVIADMQSKINKAQKNVDKLLNNITKDEEKNS